MNIDEVPREGNVALAGVRKAVYARAENGLLVPVASEGWEVEEIVTLQAVAVLDAQATAALERARRGEASPLEYWMYARRMDVAVLAQSAGMWQWRVRRHLLPQHFAHLSAAQLARYAEALGLEPHQLQTLP